MPPKIARLAGLGALAACGAFIALFAYVAYISRHTTTGGMMPALSAVSWISLGLVVLALIAVHVAIGRQLLYVGRGGGPREL
jgi:TRAP-type C4-dicarboxylate transport system permease small subunit